MSDPVEIPPGHEIIARLASEEDARYSAHTSLRYRPDRHYWLRTNTMADGSPCWEVVASPAGATETITWHLFESAPRDRPIFVASDAGHVTLARWNEGIGGWTSEVGTFKPDGQFKLTHWADIKGPNNK